MNALLIPLFLASLFKDVQWKHSPEYTFDVEMNITSIPMDHDGTHIINAMAMDLFCRPKQPYALYCHLDNCTRQTTDPTVDNKVDLSEDEFRYLCGEKPFEVRFDEHGVSYLIVNGDIHTSKLNDLKLIAERFNVGGYSDDRRGGTFDVVENTTIGQCVVNMDVKYFPSNRRYKKFLYEMGPKSQPSKHRDEYLVIQKTTNLNNCSHYAPFYFGKYGNNVVVEPDLHSHLESSVSHIYMSNDRFVSTLTRTGTMGSDKTNNLVAIHQYIRLSLKNVRDVEEELVSEIEKPSKTFIEVNSDVAAIPDDMLKSYKK
ncbi:uncharacterized protein LOC143341298 [Colletes latitarsis]|uniref:uncharacterized protein LOC143341298 n=1 Tax=Colletes latitarsis TaxID=2605962 RepID=UPI0040371216